jgi:hypothetical protein
MTDAQKLMQRYKFHNDAYNQMRHLANDARIVGMTEEAAQLCKDAEPHKAFAEVIYNQIMGVK